MTINFGAKFISTNTIRKCQTDTGLYKPTKINIVELEPDNMNDMSALCATKEKWDNGVFVPDITKDFEATVHNTIEPKYNKFYAVTTQEKDYCKLDNEQILGIAEIKKEKNERIYLKYLQVKPQTMYASKERQYRDIGKCLLDFIKSFKKIIFLKSDYRAANFYDKQNFELLDADRLEYTWMPQ